MQKKKDRIVELITKFDGDERAKLVKLTRKGGKHREGAGNERNRKQKRGGKDKEKAGGN